MKKYYFLLFAFFVFNLSFYKSKESNFNYEIIYKFEMKADEQKLKDNQKNLDPIFARFGASKEGNRMAQNLVKMFNDNISTFTLKFNSSYSYFTSSSTVNFTKQNLKISSCGKVNLEYFDTNLPKVLEAVNHNSCLHKKIAIDIEGNIRNCLSMPQNFGNIKDTRLEEALQHNDFKKYWNLTKDQIEVCKDCEFRYICTDCRAYTERSHINKEGLDTSKPLKCSYNPYTGEWEEWCTNSLKQKALNTMVFKK
jgi:SPASM domain peptide maturase of grasp-with-spasm system